ncbi:histidine phosphatase family protein [Tropicibacter sp. S64]|uniref:histidine phosphatase family protein n=1 Tax=Tropicibacter sp. S64 TaxID=3415122 RepID=UPI003C7D4476
MALTLLRHTRPEGAEGLCYGVSDLPLAVAFEQDLQGVLERLPEVSGIVTSPLQRCRTLAERIGGHLSLGVAVSEHWREMDFGRWEGTPWDAIPRAELDQWAGDFHGFDGHGGESVSALRARVAAGLDAAQDGTLIVTHMGCIKAAFVLRGDPAGWDARLPFGGMVTL